jgi:hypothetical protein
MEPVSRTSCKRTEEKLALRSILGDFLADRGVLEPCWYRLISTRDKHIPNTEKPSHIPALSQVFGMNDRLSDDLLLACGLLYYHGDQLRVSKQQWELFLGEFRLYDVEVTRLTLTALIGCRVNVIRIGAFVGDDEKLDAGKLAARIQNGIF